MSNKPWKIRIIIADRREMFREGLRILLEEQPGFQVVADLASGAKLPAVAVEHKPDVILIAEPWSFRGHIAGELRDSGFACEPSQVVVTTKLASPTGNFRNRKAIPFQVTGFER